MTYRTEVECIAVGETVILLTILFNTLACYYLVLVHKSSLV